MADALAVAMGVVLLAFLPPLLFLARVRRAERSRPEPWRALLKAFGWGALGAAALSILLEGALVGSADPTLLGAIPLLAVVVAPIVEESMKALGLLAIRDVDPEPEDGLVYGAAVGLGFAATENLVYVGAALLVGGSSLALTTALYRAAATVALHASATAITGYGVWAARYHLVQGSWLIPLLLAIGLHAAYNAVAGLDPFWALLAAVVLALFTFSRILRRIRRLDAAGARGP